MNNQETEDFDSIVSCRHRFVTRKGRVSERYFVMCSICSKVRTWYPIPKGAILQVPTSEQ
jgi:hypothetical protein